MKIVVEPAGARAAAAVLHGALPLQGQRIGVLISGENVDADTFGRLIAR